MDVYKRAHWIGLNWIDGDDVVLKETGNKKLHCKLAIIHTLSMLQQ